jgi:hypothetical protein
MRCTETLRLTLTLSLATLFVACSESRPTPSGPSGPTTRSDAGTNNPTGMSCGNGVINGLEACDGSAFAPGNTCAALGLRTGNLGCKSDCTLDTAGCGVRDYCAANNLYGNGQCDPCELLGGGPDADCDVVCGMDGTCGDRFDPLTNTWTCRRLNKTDPDCGMCGNSVVDGNELCDDRAFANGKITCTDYGFLGGDLGCKRDCAPDFAGCRYSVCGDGNKEGPEACDGTTFDGTTCEGRGFAGGMLTCTSSCTVSDTSCVRPGCANSILEPALGEECEGTNLNNATCQTRGFAGGTLGCTGTCQYDDARCVAAGCGNGIREMNEACEGTDLNGGTCMGEGFLGGMLSCSGTSCTYDTSMCVSPGCGNSIIEAGTMEQCEGTNLNNTTCQMLAGFVGGTLSCGSDCRFDTSQCTMAGCGNNVLESPAEQCEGSNLNGASCTSQGFVAGVLGCDGACRFDTSRCVMGGCGNGIAESGEACDGNDLRNATCTQQGYTGGQVRCAANCQLDTTMCTGAGQVCGDGRVNGNEICDGALFNPGLTSRDCGGFNAGTGQVRCVNCRLDFGTCSNTDYCAANMYYGDGACDVCQLGGGMRDTADCGASAASRGGCGANGQCAEYFDAVIGTYTCQALYSQRDPDCGCGDGFLDPPQANGLLTEVCEGMNSNVAMTCSSYGFTSGTVRCNATCGLDFSNCR